MGDAFIFIAGVLVTLIWFGAIGGLIWAAYQDGQAEAARKRRQHSKHAGSD